LCCVVRKKKGENLTLQEYILSVSDVSDVCCKCCICVAKIDGDIAHVVIAIHICFISSRRMLQMFYLDVAKVDLDVAYVCNGFQMFSQVV
jgi:hypothetical protein